MNVWHGWVVALALAIVGVWREWSGRHARARFEARIDKLESGATYRELQEFCVASVKAVRKAHDQMDAMQRTMDRMRADAESMAVKLAAAEARLSGALLECARWEEKVQRMIASRT